MDVFLALRFATFPLKFETPPDKIALAFDRNSPILFLPISQVKYRHLSTFLSILWRTPKNNGDSLLHIFSGRCDIKSLYILTGQR